MGSLRTFVGSWVKKKEVARSSFPSTKSSDKTKILKENKFKATEEQTTIALSGLNDSLTSGNGF